MDLDQSLLSLPTDGGMKLPPGVVANAPYQGASPMLPHIPIPLSSLYGTKTDRNRRDPRNQQRQAWRTAPPDAATPLSLSPSVSSLTGAPPPGVIRPTMRNAAVLGLSSEQLHQITGGCEHAEYPGSFNQWTYEMRREAQQVLPFLYLGPSNAARDRTFLRRTGITKVVAVRDSRLADARLLVVEHVAKEMGIVSECIDVTGLGDLLRALPAAVQSINQHMLHDVPTDANGVSTGKVLVFCETGNVRAPPVVAAYLMSMFGMELVDTLRFLSKMRFCISLDEEAKHMLLSFGDLLNARRDVAEQALTDGGDTHDDDDDDDLMQDGGNHRIQESFENAGVGSDGSDDRLSRAHATAQQTDSRLDARLNLLAVPFPSYSSTRGSRSRSRPAKRSVEETMDEEDDRIEGASEHAPSREPSAEPGRLNLDMARYQDRAQFVPFTDMGPA